MAIYTLAEIETEISTYKAALTGLAAGKSIQIGDKTLTRHDIPTVREHLQYLDQQRSALTASPAQSRAYGRTLAGNSRGRS